jgi:hypothetical protein
MVEDLTDLRFDSTSDDKTSEPVKHNDSLLTEGDTKIAAEESK